MTSDFQKLAKFACGSDAAKGIVDKHMRAARTEIVQLNKSRKKKRVAREAGPSAGDNNQDPPVPPTSTGPTPATTPTGRAPPPTPMGRGGPPPPMERAGRGPPCPPMGRAAHAPVPPPMARAEQPPPMGHGGPRVSNASASLPMGNTTQCHTNCTKRMSLTSNDDEVATPRDPPKSTTKGGQGVDATIQLLNCTRKGKIGAATTTQISTMPLAALRSWRDNLVT